MNSTAIRPKPLDVSPKALADVADERLEAELCQLAADLAAGTARWFALIAEYDRRQVWASWECRSMAAWLEGHVGVSRFNARQYVQVARTLEHFPLLNATFETGRLSYSRVRAVCRVITPTSEKDLVNMALSDGPDPSDSLRSPLDRGRNATAPQLERFVRSVERASKRTAPDDDRSQHERRQFAIVADDDGTWIVRGRLPAEVGTALRRALDMDMARERKRRATEERSVQGNAPVQPLGSCCESYEQLQVDALERVLTAGHVALEQRCSSARAICKEEPVSSRQTTAQSDSAASPRHLVVIHRYPDGDELESGPSLTHAHADRLSMEASLLEATHHRTCDAAGSLIDERVSYRRLHPRVARATQRRALRDRDQACRFTGCSHQGSLHAHHIHEYHRGGKTVTVNMILLCSKHHHALHRNGWSIVGDPGGAFQFTRTGLPHPNPDNGDVEALVDRFTGPITPAMRGERFDLGLAVMAFLHNEPLANEPLANEPLANETPTVSEISVRMGHGL
jgi:hypothetical protein